jgi:hypothetical protein
MLTSEPPAIPDQPNSSMYRFYGWSSDDCCWIKSEWSTTGNNRNAKYYELTRRGRKELENQTAAWHQLTSIIGQVLDAT